jgi:hypothetical protein
VKTLWAEIRRCLLGLPREEISYARRGFRGATTEMRARLEQVGAAFLDGYQAALEHGAANGLAGALERLALDVRGFAFEGAAMGLALQDCLTPWRADRLSRFLRGAGEPHAYMVHVGVGWVWARSRFGQSRAQRRLDPLLQWLAFDGWGFHEGFFHWPKYISGQPAPRRLAGYERRAFDQGLGRSWWFVNGGNPELIASTIGNFNESRQPDLWSGIGLAATYAGMVSEDSLGALRESAGVHWPHLAQGAAFAAKARQRAANLTDYTDLAARTLCSLSALEAARLCDTTLGAPASLPACCSSDGQPPRYELWRRRIQNTFQNSQISNLKFQIA